MIPYGNCRDTTHSRGVVDKHKPVTPGNNDVMRKLVLYDDICDNLGCECAYGLRQRPVHHILEIVLIWQLGFDLSNRMR